MSRKTRRANKTKKPTLQPFDLSSLDEIMSQNSIKCGEWRKNSVKTCSDTTAFFNGYERVFGKYKGLFDEKYKQIMESDNIQKLTGKVPYMPNVKCKQIVFGAGEDIVLYIAINNKFKQLGKAQPFTLFMPPTWDEEANLLFTQCAISHQLNNCANEFFIRILLPKNIGRLLDKTQKARISLLEICTVAKYVRDWDLPTYIYKTPASFDYDIVFI